LLFRREQLRGRCARLPLFFPGYSEFFYARDDVSETFH
jgi:hypothetical protein